MNISEYVDRWLEEHREAKQNRETLIAILNDYKQHILDLMIKDDKEDGINSITKPN